MDPQPSPPGRLRRLLASLGTPRPPPAERRERFFYGAAQPALGAAVLLRDRPLLREALKPVFWLAAFCAFAAWLHIGAGNTFLARFYTTFALLAPLPSVIFAPHYARIAAAVRNKLGLGPVTPKIEPLHTAAFRAVAQAVVVFIGLLPLIAVIKLVPGVGAVLAKAVAAVWALQWIVVDAFDGARTMKPGETLRTLERQNELAPRPWFARAFISLGEQIPLVGGPLRAFGKLVDKLSKNFREECALIERHPALIAGFALMTAALLALPVLNLFFRPIILAASAHLLGHLEKTEPHPVPLAAMPQPAGLKLPVA